MARELTSSMLRNSLDSSARAKGKFTCALIKVIIINNIKILALFFILLILHVAS